MPDTTSSASLIGIIGGSGFYRLEGFSLTRISHEHWVKCDKQWMNVQLLFFLLFLKQ